MTITSGHEMQDPQGDPAFFFVFPDLFVAVEGTFRLKFTLLRLSDNVDLCEHECEAPEVFAFSEPFQVFASKDYPGMRGKFVVVGGVDDFIICFVDRIHRSYATHRKAGHQGAPSQ